MREFVTCRCGARGKVRIIQGATMIFWRRQDSCWWQDAWNGLDKACGFCGIPSKTLVYEGLAEWSKKPVKGFGTEDPT